MKKVYLINPVSKPRMNRGDKWKKRKCVLKYWAFKDEVRAKKLKLPVCNYHVTFIVPMPKSWTKKKRSEMDGEGHQQKPDKDNFEKALLDSVFDEDSIVWDGRVTKRWGVLGKIIVETEEII